MEKRIFGRTGLEVSVLGFGAAPIGYLKTDQEQIARILNLLLDRGINVIDTAVSYHGSEEAIGKAVSHRRSDYVLISKCGRPVAGEITGKAWSEQVITQSVDRSLRRLRTDHLDAMLLHSCDLATLKAGEALGALIKARDAGKVRFIGYSGDNDEAAFAASHPEVAVLETSINLADQANIDLVLPVARQHNVGVIAKRPIANAAWKSASKQEGIYVDYAEPYRKRLAAMGITPADVGITGEEDRAWTELALRFTLSQEGVHTAIVGTTNPKHLSTNFELAGLGPLSDAQVQQVRSAFRNAEQAAGERWVGLT